MSTQIKHKSRPKAAASWVLSFPEGSGQFSLSALQAGIISLLAEGKKRAGLHYELVWLGHDAPTSSAMYIAQDQVHLHRFAAVISKRASAPNLLLQMTDIYAGNGRLLEFIDAVTAAHGRMEMAITAARYGLAQKLAALLWKNRPAALTCTVAEMPRAGSPIHCGS